MSTNIELRKKMRTLRRSLSETQQVAHAKAICQQLIERPEWSSWQHIAFYEAHDGEIDLMPCVREAWLAEKTVYMPQLTAEGTLVFGKLTPETELEANQFGILEPQHTIFRSAQELDCIILPLVSFDRTGGRLGMGMGYYDKTLAFTKNTEAPFLIGVAHACQEVGLLVQNPWDIAIPYFITEEEFITV